MLKSLHCNIKKDVRSHFTFYIYKCKEAIFTFYIYKFSMDWKFPLFLAYIDEKLITFDSTSQKRWDTI